MASLPAIAFDVYMQNGYRYKDNGDKLLFVLDYSNSMGEYLEHKTKVNQVKEMMNYINVNPNNFKLIRNYIKDSTIKSKMSIQGQVPKGHFVHLRNVPKRTRR